VSADILNFGPERFFNRELSWLEFNVRVLEEAENARNPLLERLRFLAISGSNLDEFYRVRVAGLHELAETGEDEPSFDGMTPREQVQAINRRTAEICARQMAIWESLREELEAEGIVLLSASDTTEEDRAWLKTYFMKHIFAALSALAVDPPNEFPHILNQQIAILFEAVPLGGSHGTTQVIAIPQRLERFIALPAQKTANGGTLHRFVAIETMIELFADTLLPGNTVRLLGLIRPLRSSEIDFQEKSEDLKKSLRKALNQRQLGEVIRLEASTGLSEDILDLVTGEMEATVDDIVPVCGLFAISDVSQLIVTNRPDLLYKPFDIRFPERIAEYDNDCFAAIAAKDIVVHHPYEAFDVVLLYLRQAAADPDVIAIKWTLYRTSKRSPVVEALREAQEAGKQVTVMIELMARFDELNNLGWARQLEEAGVNVVYGLTSLELKTHAKLGLIVRREDGGLRTYCHIGTGNYHPATARIYTDISYFTADPAIGRDVTKIFNYVTTYSRPRDLERIHISPHGIKNKIIASIHGEIAHAKAGRPAAIWLKLNSLVDPDVIDALYEASRNDVSVEIIVRGICCLRPGVPGLSDNIRAKSIVGRFLEHSRIYCFGDGHGLPSESAKVYISSADMMPRNLERRVEAMTEITNPTVHEQILGQIMIANLKDNLQSWIIQADGTSVRDRLEPGEEPFSAHEYFMTNPSLSGRGDALKRKQPRRFAFADFAEAF
jgi:polyphosphate kinase